MRAAGSFDVKLAPLDGYSADIEESTEGVMLSAQRAAVYLELVRQAAEIRHERCQVRAHTFSVAQGSAPRGSRKITVLCP